MCIKSLYEIAIGISKSPILWKSQTCISHLVGLGHCSAIGIFGKKLPFLDTAPPQHSTSALVAGVHFIPYVNSTKPELEPGGSHCTELKEFSLLPLSNKTSLCLAPPEEGFAVHPPGKFLLAGSQERGGVVSTTARCCNYCTCVPLHFKLLS